MKRITYLLVLITCFVGCKVVEPQKAPVIIPESDTRLVVMGLDIGPSVDKEFAQKALDLLNLAYTSGCLRESFLSHSFKSLKNIDGEQVKTPEEAYKRLIAGAPYALDLKWYYKRFSKTVGYTYNYDGKESETRIWSNTKFIKTPEGYASHLMHELSHQARAGAFVHYSFHQGSVPYELNTIVEKCLSSIPH